MAQRRLSASDWTFAALDALAEVGLAGVAVEPLATRLGATKGSFYWHFTNRDALIAATMQLWERSCTDAVIAMVETTADPADRLRILFTTVLSHAADGRLESNLLAAAEHPLVGPVVHRVAARRLDYTVQLFTEAGFAPDEARRRGLLAYAAYVGHAQIGAKLPELRPSAQRDQQAAHLETVLSLLLASNAER